MRAFSPNPSPISSILSLGLVLVALSGCESVPTGLPQPLADREQRMEHGYLFYLDGAGGGTAHQNWAGGVQQGLLEAGYPGAGEMYSWETGKGLAKDQTASVEYKRSKATGLAKEVRKYREEHPDAPVGILGFSAGCAEAVFALEALDEGVTVDQVVLLGASISQDYDLTEALSHVNDKLYIFTSTHDEMLGFMMKFSGTADRRFHDPGAGIHGFVLPPGADAETKSLYARKIVTIPWEKEWKADGDKGHHFDNVKPEFIRAHVGPIFVAGTDS